MEFIIELIGEVVFGVIGDIINESSDNIRDRKANRTFDFNNDMFLRNIIVISRRECEGINYSINNYYCTWIYDV